MERRRLDGRAHSRGHHPGRDVQEGLPQLRAGCGEVCRAHRLSRDAQGIRGRRRQGDPHVQQQGGVGAELPSGPGGSPRVAHLHDAALHRRPPHRGADRGGPAGRGGGAEWPGLLHAAEVSEDLRGGAPGDRAKGHFQGDGTGGSEADSQHWLHWRGDHRVPLQRADGEVLLPGAEPQAAGGASRDGGHHRGEPAGDAASGGDGRPPAAHAPGPRLLRSGQRRHHLEH
mmetsp:Transcript_57567/g.137099  ORF Transcript_57567/g.137099 Transcript_57567/m.137099 type:complete len:228 (-) Transcript_57567:615-1298(-)